VLQRWDGKVAPNSVGALLFDRFRADFASLVLCSHLL
jgi:hypothetical protein